MELKCPKKCTVCPDRVPKLEKELRTLKESPRYAKAVLLCCKALVKHDNEQKVADIFKKFLLDEPVEDVMFNFDVIINLLKQLGKKLTAAFEVLVPGIADTFRKTLKDAGPKGMAGLVMLRLGWIGRFAQDTLDKFDNLMRQACDWPTFSPTSGVQSAASAKAIPTQNDKPRSKPVCATVQPPKKEETSREETRVQRVSSLPTQAEVLNSSRMRGILKKCKQYRNSGFTSKKARRASDSTDSGIESQGSLSPTESNVERPRPEVPKACMKLVIKCGTEVLLNRTIPKKRMAEQKLEGFSSKKSRNDAF